MKNQVASFPAMKRLLNDCGNLMIVDSHCHLDFPDFEGDLAGVVTRAQAAGVQRMVTICTRLDKFDAVAALTRAHTPIFMAAGVHPHEAGTHGLINPDDLLALCTAPKMVGIGETGLDFFYERSPRMAQEVSFRHHITVARQTQMPLIVHTRDAENDTIRILQDEARAGAYPGLIHCFTGTPYLRDAALELGFYISASGIATFKKSEDLRSALAGVPLDRILVETDAPYLAPMPYRGKTNEPAYVAHTAQAMAGVFDMDFVAFAAQTTDNFHTLFTRVPR